MKPTCVLGHVWDTQAKPRAGLTPVICRVCKLKAKLKGNPYKKDEK